MPHGYWKPCYQVGSRVFSHPASADRTVAPKLFHSIQPAIRNGLGLCVAARVRPCVPSRNQ